MSKEVNRKSEDLPYPGFGRVVLLSSSLAMMSGCVEDLLLAHECASLLDEVTFFPQDLVSKTIDLAAVGAFEEKYAWQFFKATSVFVHAQEHGAKKPAEKNGKNHRCRGLQTLGY